MKNFEAKFMQPKNPEEEKKAAEIPQAEIISGQPQQEGGTDNAKQIDTIQRKIDDQNKIEEIREQLGIEVANDVRKQMKKYDDVDTLMAKVNKNSQLNLQVKSGKFIKGDNDVIDMIDWKVGMTKNIQKDNQVVFVDVKQVLPAQPKTLDESKGLVTASQNNNSAHILNFFILSSIKPG